MWRIVFLLLLLINLGCADTVREEDLQHLNGYWEIEKVDFPEGESKQYSLNTTIDYITIEGDSGYRKKVQPRLDGTFLTSDDAANFRIIKTEDSYSLLYSNSFDQWEEQLIAISAEEFTVVNQDNIRYHYKRFHTMAIEQ